MTNEKTVVVKGSVSALEVLQIVFIIMKLAKVGSVANWSWWWVLAPTWIPAALVLAIFALAGLIFLAAYLKGKIFPGAKRQ